MAQSLDFTGRVVVITGVGRVGQIGHAVAEGFGRAGAKLVICDVNAVNVSARAKEFTAGGIEAKAAAGDLTRADAANWVMEQAHETYGRLDVLINVAGGMTGVTPAVEAEAEVLDREFAINLKTMYVVSRAAAAAMVKQNEGGAIVSFASVAALHAKPGMAAYSAAKAGVAAVTRSLALELRDSRIRVNAVAPGLVRTRENRESVGDSPGAVWVEIPDIVSAVQFLASDLAAGITGHVLPVSRGEL